MIYRSLQCFYIPFVDKRRRLHVFKSKNSNRFVFFSFEGNKTLLSVHIVKNKQIEIFTFKHVNVAPFISKRNVEAMQSFETVGRDRIARTENGNVKCNSAVVQMFFFW